MKTKDLKAVFHDWLRRRDVWKPADNETLVTLRAL